MHEPETAQVIANTLEVEGVRRLALAVPAPWPFVAGQVAELATTPGSEGYFALASAPHEIDGGAAQPHGARLEFLIKASDSDSEPLMRVAPGDPVHVRGPFGRGYTLPPPSAGPADLLFVSAGTALAAVRSAIAERLVAATRDPRERITLLVGVRRTSDLCFAGELAAWAGQGVTIGVALSQEPPRAAPWTTVTGRVQALLPLHIRSGMRAFIAGSEELEDDVTALLVAAGMPPAHIQRNYRPDGRDLEAR